MSFSVRVCVGVCVSAYENVHVQCGLKMSSSMHEYWVECVHGQHSVKLAGEIVRDIIKLLLIPAR